jgi:hypothetical protein
MGSRDVAVAKRGYGQGRTVSSTSSKPLGSRNLPSVASAPRGGWCGPAVAKDQPTGESTGALADEPARETTGDQHKPI